MHNVLFHHIDVRKELDINERKLASIEIKVFIFLELELISNLYLWTCTHKL